MGNIVTTLKRFLSNKNTVTILGVLLGLVVLFIGYNYRVSTAVETINIPYAKRALSAAEEITYDAVGTMEVLRSTVNNNKMLISDMNKVVSSAQSYCVTENSIIPEGSFFYVDQVKNCNLVNKNVLRNMPDGYAPVSIPVDLQSTYGNSMFPGDYIDLYAKMQTEDGLLIYGEFVSKLPIMDVRDSNSHSIRYDLNNAGAPALLMFAVPKDLYLLLSKAVILADNIVELVPVPGNASYSSEPGETKVQSEFLRQEILKHTASIPDEVVPSY